MKDKRRLGIPFALFALIGGGLLFRFGEAWLRHVLLYLSTAVWARKMMSNSALAWRVASRFVAGVDRDAAMTAARALNDKGMRVTLDLLGENIARAADAVDARNEIITLLDTIQDAGVDASVSVKLSQLGLKLEPQLALENLRPILEKARATANRIRIDMEDSATVDDTLHIYHTLRDDEGFDNVGVVIQAYLHRSKADVTQLVEEGASVRLCKGAYAEPPEIAFAHKQDTDAHFVQLMQLMLSETARVNGVYLGVATHDDAMIDATIAYAQAHGIAKDAFEFQMLYGVRREKQEALVADGYQMRVYVPFGKAWYPYFVRRLAERPANLWFFVSNFFKR